MNLQKKKENKLSCECLLRELKKTKMKKKHKGNEKCYNHIIM